MKFHSKKGNSIAQPIGFRDKWARWQFHRVMDRISIGNVTVVESRKMESFGESSDLAAAVSVNRHCFYRKALFGSVSIADSYIRGDWDCNNLTELIQIFLRNRNSVDRSRSLSARCANFGYRMFHWARRNTLVGSQNNIAAHYDLGNDFYKLWLDETMAYSSGVFLHPDSTLHDASVEKFDRVCRKLDLECGDKVLEIGTGFGGFAVHAAENYGAKITTTTISQRQHEFAQERFRHSTSSDKINLLQKDYRRLTGKYDKLVSIEMVEAVGYQFFDQFFAKCSSLLRDDGSLVLQAIVMPERGYDRYLNSVDFIQRYVFPGGCLPSLSAILESVGRSTDMRLVHVEDMAPHYAETLKRWHDSFELKLDTVREQGYSEELIRMWRFYLCYCRAAFLERYTGVLQIQFDKPDCKRDPIGIGKRAATPVVRTHQQHEHAKRSIKKELSNEYC